MSQMIIAERRLQRMLLDDAREELGPTATEAEVQALADEAYYGPSEPPRTESEEERRERNKRFEQVVAETAEVLKANGL